MNINNAVDKYFWSNIIGDRRNVGIFKFENVSAFIKESVKNGENLGPRKFLDTILDQEKSRLDHFIPIICRESNSTRDQVEKSLINRLLNVFYGIYGEAILERMYSRSTKYDLLEVSDELDYGSHVDLRVKDLSSGFILNIQVKTIKHLLSPSFFQSEKIRQEKEIHKKNGLDVVYSFYNHPYDSRYFIINGIRLNIKGYGSNHVRQLERITDSIIQNYKNKNEGKITYKNLVF